MRTILRPFEISFSNKVKTLFTKTFKSLSLLFICITGISSTVVAQDRALDFTPSAGTANYVTLPNLIPSGSYTKEAWVNARTFGAAANNILSGTTTAFWAPNGNLSSGHNFDYTSIQDAGTMNTGQWYHVAVTYNAGTNSMILYRDGVSVATGNPLGVNTETEAYIGTYNNGGGPGDFEWDGQIDEVRIWNVVRSITDIANNRNCILTGDEPGLLAYYDFDQGTGGGNNAGVTTLLDRSDRCNTNSNNNGTLSNFTLNGATSNWVTPGAGVSGSCGGNFSNINVTGNSLCITPGDATAGLPDHTYFGNGPLITRTFTIENTGTGTAPLVITSITITGPDAADFGLTSAPSSPVAVGASTTFDITFNPSTNPIKNATINVNNDDGDEAVYSFAIQAQFSTLPVNLKSFTIRKEGNRAARLNWVTSTESNNRGFEIQRQKERDNWITLGFVPGAGSSTSDQSYTYTDLTPQKGINYYRLKQIDLDNRAKISEIRSVTFANGYTIVYPVPTNDKVVIELNDSKLIGTRATLSDQQGRLIRAITITKMQQEVSLSVLPPGFYMLKMEDGSVNKLVKQ